MSNKSKFDTNINIIGSIKELDVIRKAFEAYFVEQDSVDSLLVERNEFVYKTYKTTSRISSGIVSTFIKFKNDKHREIYKIIFTGNYPIELQNYAIFLQFAINNDLFLMITKDVFVKVYLSGRITIKSEDIYGYLKNALDTNIINDVKWSESTIKIIPNKYLNFIKKLNFIDEKTKNFKLINISTASFYLFLLVSSICTESKNLFDSALLPLCFMEKDSLVLKSKLLGQNEYIDMNYNGESLNIILKDNVKEVLDVLSN